MTETSGIGGLIGLGVGLVVLDSVLNRRRRPVYRRASTCRRRRR